MIANVKYLDFNSVKNKSEGELKEEMQVFVDMHPHNNGYSTWFEVFDPELNDEYAYPLINEMLIKDGAKIGDCILFHFCW